MIARSSTVIVIVINSINKNIIVSVIIGIVSGTYAAVRADDQDTESRRAWLPQRLPAAEEDRQRELRRGIPRHAQGEDLTSSAVQTRHRHLTDDFVLGRTDMHTRVSYRSGLFRTVSQREKQQYVLKKVRLDNVGTKESQNASTVLAVS